MDGLACFGLGRESDPVNLKAVPPSAAEDLARALHRGTYVGGLSCRAESLLGAYSRGPLWCRGVDWSIAGFKSVRLRTLRLKA